MICSVEPLICTKIHRNLTEKLSAKLPAAVHGYSMIKFACLDDNAFSEFFELEANPIEGQSLQQNDKGKAKKSRNFDVNAVLVERKAYCYVTNAFLKLIWPICRLKISKMVKNSSSQWVKFMIN